MRREKNKKLLRIFAHSPLHLLPVLPSASGDTVDDWKLKHLKNSIIFRVEEENIPNSDAKRHRKIETGNESVNFQTTQCNLGPT